MTSSFPGGPTEVGVADLEAKPGRRADPWAIAMGILGGVLLGTGLTFALLGMVGVFQEPTPPTNPPAPVLTAPSPAADPPPTFGDEASVASVAAQVIPSTVFVEGSRFFMDGGGSGVVYGNDGYIITNHHVISAISDISVTFSDGARFPAEVIGSDPVTDIGVLLVQRTGLYGTTIGSADSLSIGEPVVAIGNPLGLAGGPTVTTGVVSALNRVLQVGGGDPLAGLVQTDAPIAPGSSGGALVDSAGRLIGITTAMVVSQAGAEGLGFAVPVEIAVGVADDLIETGEVRHAQLGITGDTVWAEENGAEFPVGVLIASVTGGSAYEAAGGQMNDVILALDDFEVRTFEALLGQMRRLRAGDIIPVRILRGDTEMTLDVTMGRHSR